MSSSTPLPRSTVVYLITGANRGLGFALVEALSARPDSLIFAGVRDLSKADRLKVLHEQKGNVHVLQISSGDVNDNREAADAIQRQAGRLDVVIANAGIADWMGKVDLTPSDEVRRHVEVNTIGPLVLFQSILPLLRQSSSPKWVVMSSGAGSIGRQSENRMPVAAYGASKAAVNFITRKIHFEFEELTAFPITPGWTETDMGYKAVAMTGLAKQPPVRLSDSVNGMLAVIDAAKRESHSGRFWSYDGTEVPW